jgi:aspartate kinase
MIRIFKFGGASVKDADSIRNLLTILKEQDKHSLLVIVVSAMGKTTQKLEDIFQKVSTGEDFESEFEQLKSYHLYIQKELLNSSDVLSEIFTQIEESLKRSHPNYYQGLDEVLSFGEILSTTLIAEFLNLEINAKWLDARKIIKTNDMFGEARINWKTTERNLKNEIDTNESQMYIIQGFIGSNDKGQITTLGKEGSDFTASILANCLNADNVTFWKDVPGIMNADPKKMLEAQVYDQLSYQEIAEMTYYGAKVIHPKTITPLAQKGIPLFVKSFILKEEKGTTIFSSIEGKVPIPTFIIQPKQAVITVRVQDGTFIDEKKLVDILNTLDQLNVKVNMMQMSALTFTFCFDERKDKLEAIMDSLQKKYSATYNSDLTLATVKNYNEEAITKLPEYRLNILEQKSRSVFHRLYEPV